MDVTIALLIKNGEDYLSSLLTSLRGQESEVNVHILAIDSGSTDDSLEILARHSARVNQIPTEDFNHGETRNLAAREADLGSDYLVYLSQDAIPADEFWLRNLIQPMEDDPTVAGTFSRHIPRPGASPSLVRQLTTMWQTGGQERIVKAMPDDPKVYERDKFYYIYFSNTSSAIRRDVWEQIPFRKLDFAEDADWANRVLRVGFEIVFDSSTPSFIPTAKASLKILAERRSSRGSGEAVRHGPLPPISAAAPAAREYPKLGTSGLARDAQVDIP